jgi:chaperone modulatory protein CbpM
MTRSLAIAAAEMGVATEQVAVWVERRWLRPVRDGDELAFDETDVARLRMIVEFRRDLAIDDEAMPVVLDLIDRLHAARAQLRRTLLAIAELPESAQSVLIKRITGKADQ